MRRRTPQRPSILPILLALAPALAASSAAAPQDPPATAPPPASAQAAPEGSDSVLLSLQDGLQAALENNLDIRVRRVDPLRSRALSIVAEAGFDPLLTGTARSSELEEPRPSSFLRSLRSDSFVVSWDDPMLTGGRYRIDLEAINNDVRTIVDPAGLDEYNANWRLTLNQPLLRGFGVAANRWAILVARANVDISTAQFRQSVLDTLASSERAYWDLNFALMDLRTKIASLQLAKDFLEQNRIKVRVGTLAPIEITQAEAGVADREEGVIIAENAVLTAEDTLRRIMNVPRDSDLWSRSIRPSEEPPLVEVRPDMEEAVATALRNRPDLEQARLTVQSRDAELAFRRNQKRWGLDLEGIYGNLGFDETAYGDAFDDLRDRNQREWTVSLTLGVPIGNRLAKSQYSDARAAWEQARFEVERLEQSARIDVRNAVRLVETNLKRVRAAQVNTRLQREKLAAEQKKFENGMSTSFQVLQFQTDLSSAESRENQAIVDYNKSLVDLERAKGTLIESRHMTLPPIDDEGMFDDRQDGGGRYDDGQETGDRSGASAPNSRLTLPAQFLFDGRRLIAR